MKLSSPGTSSLPQLLTPFHRKEVQGSSPSFSLRGGFFSPHHGNMLYFLRRRQQARSFSTQSKIDAAKIRLDFEAFRWRCKLLKRMRKVFSGSSPLTYSACCSFCSCFWRWRTNYITFTVLSFCLVSRLLNVHVLLLAKLIFVYSCF